jgi:cytoskeletal protein RodZ
MSEKRKLTPFLAHEMLFDYETDHLDPGRRQAIENFIKDDRESQNLLDAIRRGISYSESLKKIELSASSFEELEQAESFITLSRRLARFSKWPDSLRWSLIALLISVCTAGVVVLIPWNLLPMLQSGPKFESGTVEIARVDGRKLPDGTVAIAANDEETDDQQTGPMEGSGDEEFAEESSGAVPPASTVAVPSAVIASPKLPTPAPVVSVATAPAVKTNAPVSAPVNRPNATPKPVATSAAASPTVVSSEKASRGYVYRAFMTLADLENVTPKITQQIKELGAEKAGEVELGWRRGSGRYYHFSMPESNEQRLLETLRGYGPVRISKDPHPRVMPPGQVRFILWVESGI